MENFEKADGRRRGRKEYFIMQGNRQVVSVCENGICMILMEELMPYNLYLEQGEDIDTRLQNLGNFYHWCASRVLTLDRTYAKEILNSIGVVQAATDKDRAQIALSCHCVSLTDIYWTKEKGEEKDFSSLNLYKNHLEAAFVDVSLRGKQMTIESPHLIAGDLSAQGCFPKAWLRRKDGIYLIKGGEREAVEGELLASRICGCFQMEQVSYQEESYDGQKVSVSKIITSLDYGIVPMEHFEIYCVNHGIDRMQYILELDAYSYYMMNIMDYLVGNTDRHWGNWGLLVAHETNRPMRLHALMDFNKAFGAYDREEGANCLTVPGKISQKDAALEAVGKVGLNQVKEVDESWFLDKQRREMFARRLCLLKEQRERNAGGQI